MKVRLKPVAAAQKVVSVASFNSMKVRLKPSAAIVSRLDLLFQFHEGPIKT